MCMRLRRAQYSEISIVFQFHDARPQSMALIARRNSIDSPDQERILETELYRFVRFHWDIVVNLAGASGP